MSALSRRRQISSLTKKFFDSAYKYGPAAKKIAKGIKKKYSKKSSQSQTEPHRGHRSKWSGTSRGTYKGKFKKPKKNKMTLEKVCLMKGAGYTSENFGRIDDPHAVYITHSTFQGVAYTKVIVQALIKKLFNKAGIDISSRTDELPLYDYFNSSSMRIVFVFHDQLTGAVSTPATYDIGDNQSLQQICDSFGDLSIAFEGYIANLNDAQIPSRLLLYTRDFDGDSTTNFHLASSIDILQTHLTLFGSSTLKIQNRTSGDGGSGDAGLLVERVDNQPLKGKIYEFGHLHPRLKYLNAENAPLNVAGETGIQLTRAAELGNSTYENVQPTTLWSNCIGSSNLNLQPGDIKTTYIHHKYSGTFVNIIKKMKVDAVSGLRVVGGQGRSQLVFLEELLRTAGSNPVNVQYEQNFKCGCYFTTKKKMSLTTNFFANEQNNTF